MSILVQGFLDGDAVACIILLDGFLIIQTGNTSKGPILEVNGDPDGMELGR